MISIIAVDFECALGGAGAILSSESAVSSVIRARISFAKSLLISTDMTVAAIAEKCGYNSTVHFSRQFRRETGYTPGEWKKRSY